MNILNPQKSHRSCHCQTQENKAPTPSHTTQHLIDDSSTNGSETTPNKIARGCSCSGLIGKQVYKESLETNQGRNKAEAHDEPQNEGGG
ncbi:uncharacterized protein N7529_004093 [Penicillium soppii]|jgi:hypothetical protein|uniref:uncharacterized protein n=1 Tax=Penicillium soppii TaxID=69789 RepID=UPI002547764F|nr:uncharacterized protein N7529_004093 [Penicillium soppii]KAJ5871740.1 hypothetical protein N7529_004093 [Penicillium soppii]